MESTRYYDSGRLTLMPFWRAARRRKWGIFTVLKVADYLPPVPPEERPWP
jgi:hypothetical protein